MSDDVVANKAAIFIYGQKVVIKSLNKTGIYRGYSKEKMIHKVSVGLNFYYVKTKDIQHVMMCTKCGYLFTDNCEYSG